MSFRPGASPALLAGGILLLVGLVFLAVSAAQLLENQRFAQEGRLTQGTILAKIINTSTSGSGSSRSRSRHYEATYRFAIEGTVFEGRDELLQADWERLAEGGTVDVLYLPADPASNRLAGSRPWLLQMIFGVLGLVLAPIGAALVARAIRRARLESRLRAHGMTAQGRITELGPGGLRINNVQQWRLKYEYQDASGSRHASALTLSPMEADEWHVADHGIVRYDQAKPADSVWVGRSE